MPDEKSDAKARTTHRATSNSAPAGKKLYERAASGDQEWLDPNAKETRRQVESGEIRVYVEPVREDIP